MSDVPWRAGPSWLIDRGVEERWQQREWQEWEILRQRFDEFGVELEKTDPKLTYVAAYGARSPIVERVQPSDQYPLHKALHRLVKLVAEAYRRDS